MVDKLKLYKQDRLWHVSPMTILPTEITFTQRRNWIEARQWAQYHNMIINMRGDKNDTNG